MNESGTLSPSGPWRPFTASTLTLARFGPLVPGLQRRTFRVSSPWCVSEGARCGCAAPEYADTACRDVRRALRGHRAVPEGAWCSRSRSSVIRSSRSCSLSSKAMSYPRGFVSDAAWVPSASQARQPPVLRATSRHRRTVSTILLSEAGFRRTQAASSWSGATSVPVTTTTGIRLEVNSGRTAYRQSSAARGQARRSRRRVGQIARSARRPSEAG